MRITPAHYRIYPELALFSSDGERAAALKACQKSLNRKPLIALMYGATCPAGGAAYVSRPYLSPYLPGWLVLVILVMFVSTPFAFVFNHALRRPLQRKLREELLSRGIPVCIACGYDLRGQTEPRCPECGCPFDPRLLLPPQPR